LSISSREAIEVPSKKGQQPVRAWTSPDNGEFVVVRMGIKAKKIEDGGAKNASGSVVFFPAQIRLVVKKTDAADNPLVGAATVKYPVGFLKNKTLIKQSLNEIITPDAGVLIKGAYWLDVAFDVPQGYRPVLLEFKQNAVADLTSYEVVKSTPEVERALDNWGQKEESP